MGVLIGRHDDRKAGTVKTPQVASERLVPGLRVGRDCQSKARTQIWQRDTKQVSSLEIMVTTEIKVDPLTTPWSGDVQEGASDLETRVFTLITLPFLLPA